MLFNVKARMENDEKRSSNIDQTTHAVLLLIRMIYLFMIRYGCWARPHCLCYILLLKINLYKLNGSNIKSQSKLLRQTNICKM